MTSVNQLREERVNQANRVKALGHPLRLKIFFYLVTYGQLTLKQLSDKLSKGKTTVHHNLVKLQEVGLVEYIEHEDDNKKLKTRYYSADLDKAACGFEVFWDKEYIDKLSDEEANSLKANYIGEMNSELLLLRSIVEMFIKVKETKLNEISIPELVDPKGHSWYIHLYSEDVIKEVKSEYKKFMKKISAICSCEDEEDQNDGRERKKGSAYIGFLSMFPLKEIIDDFKDLDL